MRILIWLIIAVAVVVWLKRAIAGATRSTAGQTGAPRPGPSETMLQCAHCGVHFPASEAVAGPGDAVYCSAEHRKLG